MAAGFPDSVAKDWVNASLYYLEWFAYGFIGSLLMTLDTIACAVSINCKIPALTIGTSILLFLMMVPGTFVFIFFGFAPPNWYSNAVLTCEEATDAFKEKSEKVPAGYPDSSDTFLGWYCLIQLFLLLSYFIAGICAMGKAV